MRQWALSYFVGIWEGRTPTWVFLVALVPSSAIVLFSALQPWVPLYQLVGDPLAMARQCVQEADSLVKAQICTKSYLGLLSNLGILLWSASASVSLFAFLLVYSSSKDIRPGAFLLYAGLFTAALLMDDLFEGHEKIYWRLFHISQIYIGITYGILGALYVVLFHNSILRNDAKILYVSIAFLATSLLVDEFVTVGGFLEYDGVAHRLAEDGSKFVGIFAWAVFHIRAAWLTIYHLIRPTYKAACSESAVDSAANSLPLAEAK